MRSSPTTSPPRSTPTRTPAPSSTPYAQFTGLPTVIDGTETPPDLREQRIAEDLIRLLEAGIKQRPVRSESG